jgi:hypothetical protein
MKQSSIITTVALVGAIMLSGCAYKQTYGVDRCGTPYVDTTYRTYNTQNCTPVTYIPTKSSCQQTVRPQQPVAKPAPAPAPKVVKKPQLPKNTPVLTCTRPVKITVIGQGVAPCSGTCSPSQAYALAKRAAIADAYRLIAEKVKGVYVEGDDLIKNMMLKRSTVKTSVAACVRNATVTETTFKDGLCEVEMQITLLRSQFPQ